MERITIRRNYGYEEVLKMQTALFEERVECRKNGIPLPGDVVMFVEHRPVYTLGRHGDASHLLLDPQTLRERGIEFVNIGRGGDITYHGPGQLTVYPIVDLQRLGLGVKDYVTLLEETVIRTVAEYGVKGERIEGLTGVWIDKGRSNERKICAIGIRCSRNVAMHGFALNVGKDLSSFSGIVPCGLAKGVTSISLEAGYDVELDEVEEKLWNFFNLLAGT